MPTQTSDPSSFSEMLAELVRYFGFNPSGEVQTFQLILGLCAALFAFSFCAVMPSNAFSADPNRQEVEKRFELNSATAEELAGTGAVSLEVAKKIVELRDQLGSFQSYDDLNELELPKDQMDKLRWNTTIQGIASDCNC